MSVGYSITFTQEFLMDIVKTLLTNTNLKKVSYVSFEPSDVGTMQLIIKYKELLPMSLDDAFGGHAEWVEKRIAMPITETVIPDEK